MTQQLRRVLPIGLSFHTFQSLSYTIEVYRGHQKAERRPGVFALYVMFYPQLVAGPIERPGNLLNQLNAADGHGIRSDLDYGRVIWGLKQMLWGFFKKLVIAEGRLTGAVLIGEVADALWYLELIRERKLIAGIRAGMMFGRALALSSEAA